MSWDESIAIQKEIVLFRGEVEAGFDALQAGLDECLAIAKETNAVLAEHRGCHAS